jgi:uncharacterized protein YecT (DUF1311 family)
MILRILTGLGLVVVASGAATAASFDCKKATTPFEVAICTNPDLSKADDVLAISYATAIGGLSKPALAEVQQGQRVWLDYVQRACTDDAELPKAKYPDEQMNCLVSELGNRSSRLEQSRMWGGLRVYSVESYSVIPDTTAEADAWNKVATREISVPRVDGGSAEAKAFNMLIIDQGPKLEGPMDETSDISTRATIEDVTPTRISVAINNWWYGHGAAHGNYDISYLHFLRAEQRALEVSDVFDKPGWEEKLGELALAKLDETIEGGIWEESRADAPKVAADPSRWSFSTEGLVIQYQPYEVTAYAAGAPTVTIPWAQLTDYLAEGAKYGGI